MKRPTGNCGKCGNEGDIAADGLCFKCYRRRQRRREAEQQAENGIGTEEIKLIKNYTLMLIAFRIFGLTREEVAAVKGIVDPHLARVAVLLNIQTHTGGPAAPEESPN